MAVWTALTVALAVALAGCSGAAVPTASSAATVTLEGWVFDAGYRPIVGAQAALPELNLRQATDAQGHYSMALPRSVNALLIITADGYQAASRAITGNSGPRQILNLTLEVIPDEAPVLQVEQHRGILHCAVTAVLKEDPSRPHQHQGVRCADYLPEAPNGNVWLYRIPDGASGLIVEVEWTPGTPASMALVLKIEVESTGQVLGFVEGTSLLRVQMGAFNLAKLLQTGQSDLLLTILPGAGSGSHEHGAVGLFVEQTFTMYATTFYNQPADPTYSVADGP